MTRTLDNNTLASDPGRIRLSHAKLRVLLPELYGISGLYYRLKARWQRRPAALVYVEEHLLHGDSRAAVVVSTRPLLVSAYTDEFDCVVLLRFPAEFVDEYELRVGSRLLTVNTYKNEDVFDDDLDFGPKMVEGWTGFHPIIAEFVSDDARRIARRKNEIGDVEFKRALTMGKEYLAKHPGVARDGRPIYASLPALM